MVWLNRYLNDSIQHIHKIKLAGFQLVMYEAPGISQHYRKVTAKLLLASSFSALPILPNAENL